MGTLTENESDEGICRNENEELISILVESTLLDASLTKRRFCELLRRVKLDEWGPRSLNRSNDVALRRSRLTARRRQLTDRLFD